MLSHVAVEPHVVGEYVFYQFKFSREVNHLQQENWEKNYRSFSLDVGVYRLFKKNDNASADRRMFAAVKDLQAPAMWF